MAYSKKPMTEMEKKAKLGVLKDAHKQASSAIKSNFDKFRDSKQLKSHIKDMSNESGIDFKDDSDNVEDPTKFGNVVGRHVSDENIESCDEPSTYDLPEIDARLKLLMEQKARIKGK